MARLRLQKLRKPSSQKGTHTQTSPEFRVEMVQVYALFSTDVGSHRSLSSGGRAACASERPSVSRLGALWHVHGPLGVSWAKETSGQRTQSLGERPLLGWIPTPMPGELGVLICHFVRDLGQVI